MLQTVHDEKQHQYYDAIYARGYNTRGYFPLYEEVVKLIERLGPPPRVLEIGCGVGDLGKMIVERGYPYRGFDFSPVAVECSKRLCPQGNFRTGDAYDPECYRPHDYNIVVALEVLEHLDDFAVIENIPEGVHLIASVPDYDDTAHLRLYQDPRRDIVERFRPCLQVAEISCLLRKKPTGETATIFLFHGTRVSGHEGTMVTANSSLNPPSAISLPSDFPKIGRNDLCPCGSGRKFKKCCLK
jgi:SAM-dependent methyltransferase